MVVINNDPRCAANESQAFGSFAFAISDDDYAVLNMPVDYGHVLVAESSSATHGLAWVRGSLAVRYFGGVNFDVIANVALNGTTGVDGKITISTNNSKFYIENRSGNPVNLSITFLGIAANRI